jgi:hypothetical protein
MSTVNRAAPMLVAAAIVLLAVAWSLQLAVAPEPFSPGAGAVVATGLSLYALVATAGILIARGRWSARLGFVVVAGSLGLAVVTEPGLWYAVGLTLSAACLVGLAGPWMGSWLRKLPVAGGPGAIPVVLALGSLGLVAAVGVASPDGLGAGHGVLGGAGVLLAWAYARAQLWALWALRLVLPAIAAAAIAGSPWPGGLMLTAIVATLVAMAWRREARLAVQPLPDRLPSPRSRPAKAEP